MFICYNVIFILDNKLFKIHLQSTQQNSIKIYVRGAGDKRGAFIEEGG